MILLPIIFLQTLQANILARDIIHYLDNVFPLFQYFFVLMNFGNKNIKTSHSSFLYLQFCIIVIIIFIVCFREK